MVCCDIASHIGLLHFFGVFVWWDCLVSLFGVSAFSLSKSLLKIEIKINEISGGISNSLPDQIVSSWILRMIIQMPVRMMCPTGWAEQSAVVQSAGFTSQGPLGEGSNKLASMGCWELSPVGVSPAVLEDRSRIMSCSAVAGFIWFREKKKHKR